MASPDQKKMQASWEHLQAREKEFKVKEDELKRLKAGWDSMVASSKSAEDQLAALRADLAAQVSLNKKMSGQVKDKDARIRALEAELESLRTANAGTAALQAALDEAKVATAALQAQVEAASLSRQAAIDEAAAMSQKAELLQSQVDALNRTAADATAKLQESLSKMDGNRLRLLDTDLAIQVKAAEIELLGENLKSAHSEAEQLKHTLADTLAEKQKAEARLSAMEAAFMKSAQESAALRSKQASAAEVRTAEQAKWHAEVAGLRSQLASSAQELARAHAESDAVASKHSEALRVAQEECDRLRSERDRSALDAAAARDDTAALHASIETLRTKFADEARAMSDELNAQLSREEDLKRDARKWKSEAQRLGQEHDRMSTVIASRDAELGKCAVEAASQKAELASLRAELADAQKRLRAIPELEDKLAVCQARITAEVDANSKQLDELRTTQANARRLQAQLEDVKRHAAALEQRAHAAESKNSDEVLEATAAAAQVIDAKNEEVRVLRMMLEASKIEARTKEREKQQLLKKLKGSAKSP